MNTSKISLFSKVVLLAVSALFFASLMFPMWRIELEAPQYPEGLVLQLHANKIGGDVDIINGLNHYIGMKTLHTEDFPEFQIIPYIFACFGLFALLMVFVTKREGVIILLSSFLLFGVLAGVDFYRWNYEYGHNLDPNAAIVVPGMAYQPPLIGYKQLLNFGAYSIPDIGGWMLIAAGFLLFIIVIKDSKLIQKFKNRKVVLTIMLLFSIATFSCSNNKPVPINLNKDNCDYCSMGISDGQFGSEIITEKGRAYKFDDIICMVNYCKENPKNSIAAYFVHDYSKQNILIPASSAYFLSSDAIHSPMRGGIIAFSNENIKNEVNKKYKAKTITWNSILNN
jgi:copper chaperone NosL